MNAMLQIVAVATADLTDAELAGINQIVQTCGDPRRLPSYAQVCDLFTESGGTSLHPVTRQALAAVTLYRLTRP